MRWLVDGMNVIGSRPDGWWRDRRAAMERLSVSLAAFAAETEEPLTVVFDGRPFDLSASPAGIEINFASAGGPNAADDVIAARVQQAAEPQSITVVTSDRDLAERVRAAGANVLGASQFRRRLEETSAR
jgi:predicted RNA-binding protein with PIN domain